MNLTKIEDNQMKLEVKNLKVEADGIEILHGVDLTINSGEIAGIMGKNGSGKSTLARAIFGHPDYQVTEGDILVDGESILEMSTDGRARLGLFLGFQSPYAIPGVTMNNLIRTAIHAQDPDQQMENPIKFIRRLKGKLKDMGLNGEFVNRGVNENASGGERKKSEIVQLDMLGAKLAILDEIDSGLDIDALKEVSLSINRNKEEKGMGFLLVTHYSRLLNHVKPDVIHLLYEGRVIRSGGPELASELEDKGYEELVASIV
jgi:Fe-S cluster assembly ATP-binding protein